MPQSPHARAALDCERRCGGAFVDAQNHAIDRAHTQMDKGCYGIATLGGVLDTVFHFDVKQAGGEGFAKRAVTGFGKIDQHLAYMPFAPRRAVFVGTLKRRPQ
jgi:hypothetical protein